MVKRGVKLAFLTALVSGIAIFVNKFAVGAITPPIAFTAIKNAGVGLILLIWILATAKWRTLLHVNKQQKLLLVSIAVIGGALPFYLFFTGLSIIPAINAALIHKTLVIWVAILAIFFLKEKPTISKIIAVTVLFISNFMIGGFKGLTYSTGELMVLSATILWAVETIIAKKALKKLDPDVLATARMAGGAVILLLIATISGSFSLSSLKQISSEQAFWMVITMSTLLLYVTTWYRALKYAPAITVASILVGATIITNILSAFFVTHTLNEGFLSQLVLVGVGVWLIYKATLASEPQQIAAY